MVAVIKTGHSIHRVFNYNENKVKEGVAECIGAGNYPVDPDKMSASMKLNRFLNQVKLNENVTRNSVHISLNFDVSESHFSKEKLQEIAEVYMDKIGFGKQPFLVYQHNDAGHPHIHIVSTNIRPDGSRIDMNNIGRNQSEEARKSIETDFDLVRAEDNKKQEQFQLDPISVSKVMYGKSQTKRAIQNILEEVLGKYKYTSLPELNAVLKQYNVIAEQGSENSRVFQHQGLLYRILDQAGNPIGVPIKASSFYSKPTLRFLETKFKENEAKRLPHKGRIKNAIDIALIDKKLTLQGLVKVLDKQGINAILRQNESGLVYGLTYVDHHTKCVFNGSAMGKLYSAKGIQERCYSTESIAQIIPGKANQIPTEQNRENISFLSPNAQLSDMQDKQSANAVGNILDALIETENVSEALPPGLRKRRKKKRRNQSNNL